MKHLIIALAILFSTATFGQTFDGVSISGDLPTAISKYKAKGYTLVNTFPQGVKLKGRVASREIELFIFVTPKTKKIFKMAVYLTEETSWFSLRQTYIDMLNSFKNKYGEPDDDEAKFINPYYLGDGYELQAVELEKIDYHAYWFRRDNLTVGIEISKYKQVKLIYENNIMMDLKNKEQAEIENNSF
jgi:hypothetical protein